MPADLRSLGPIERVMYLRTLPLFGTMQTRDLGAIAAWTEEREFAAGQVLFEEGAPVESIHILTRGTARVSRGEQAFRVFGPRDAVGVIGLLSRDERGVRAVALERCTTLELGRRPLLRMFEERFEIYQHLLREVAGLLIDERGEAVVDGPGAGDPLWAPPPETGDGMDLVDRMRWLGAALRFARGHAVALSELARTSELRSVPAGGIAQQAGEAADTIAIPISGSLAADARQSVGSRRAIGTALGLSESFARQSHRLTVRADEPSRLLVVHHESLIDSLEDHPDLALDCLAEVASRLLEAFLQRAETEIELPRGLGGGRQHTVPAPIEAAREVWLRS